MAIIMQDNGWSIADKIRKIYGVDACDAGAERAVAGLIEQYRKDVEVAAAEQAARAASLPEAAAEIRRLSAKLASANDEIKTLRTMIEIMRARMPQLSDLIGVTCATCGKFVYGEVPDGWIEFGDERYCSEKCYQERPEKSSPPSPVAESSMDELDALRKFKAYVHRRLDEAGVPADPDSPHKVEGCRIGGRLDLVLGEPRWIPVREKEVPSDIPVLTYRGNAWPPYMTIGSGGTSGGCSGAYVVTHWMPLPPSPVAGGPGGEERNKA